MPITPEPTRQITFNGMPAATTNYTQKSSLYLTTGNNMRFLNGDRYYFLMSTVDVFPKDAAHAPELKAEMDQALRTVTDALVPTASNNAK